MAATKKKREYITTSVGTLKYPHLQAPHAYSEGGVEGKPYYSTQLILRGGPAAELKRVVDENIARVEKEEGKKVKDMPYAEEQDGSVSFRFKCNPTWKDGKSRKPALFDRDGQPIVGEEYQIGGGTKAKVRFSVYPWTFGGKVGVRLEPWAVQIVELVEREGDAAQMGFDAIGDGDVDF
jgi:hypothetical protein